MSNRYSRERMENMGAPSLPPAFQVPQQPMAPAPTPMAPEMGGMTPPAMPEMPPMMPQAQMPMQMPTEMPQAQMPMQMQMPMGMMMPTCPLMQGMMYNPFMGAPVQGMHENCGDDDNTVSQRFRRHDFDHFRFRPFFPFRPFFFDFDDFFPFMFFDEFTPFRRF